MQKLKILVVDDEEHTRLGYAEILKMGGHEVDMAADGMEGLAKASVTDYDLIISDLHMPKMNGVEFIEKLDKSNHKAKKIVITAFGSYKSYKDTASHGTCLYLNKPVRAADLEAALYDCFK
ncbi:response regulator receiver protein [Denitrovibrio acetiphilus DSM 12809]|uniref:Response regulator receiver protein n=1 Tax=Denitrovibrio acetiphilus (strain DSM 12809 / NBRC 114555 / N2460) TaxID=522772 RepID=D4H6E3_DENA2|nr:response regulator [Denitrovibrio acetiphilus]ADD69617.1 response regulator receiver protein [Denitrovibrio acetiphilus DSM 12809]